MPFSNGTVGPNSFPDGGQPQGGFRLGNSGEIVVSELMGRYYELSKRGNLFIASNQAGVALSLLNATATGLILSNPAGSGRNLVLLDILVALTSAPAGIATLMLAGNVTQAQAATVHTTPLTIRNALLGAQLSTVALADSAATLPATPVVLRAIGGGPVATGSVTAPFVRDEVAGEIVVAPGMSISLSALTTAISVLGTFVFADVPVPTTSFGV
jgi:hypothetical protein